MIFVHGRFFPPFTKTDQRATTAADARFHRTKSILQKEKSMMKTLMPALLLALVTGLSWGQSRLESEMPAAAVAEPGTGIVAWAGASHLLSRVECRTSGRDFRITGHGDGVRLSVFFREDRDAGGFNFAQANRVDLDLEAERFGGSRYRVTARAHLDDAGRPVEGFEPMGEVSGDESGAHGQTLVRGANAESIEAHPDGLRLSLEVRCP